MKKFIIVLMLVMIMCSPVMAYENSLWGKQSIIGTTTSGWTFKLNLDTICRTDGYFMCSYVVEPATKENREYLRKEFGANAVCYVYMDKFYDDLEHSESLYYMVLDNNYGMCYVSSPKFNNNKKKILPDSILNDVKNRAVKYIKTGK